MLINKCDTLFKNRIVLECCEALEQTGFTRYRKDRVDWPLFNGFHCWVGLNAGIYSDHVFIDPFIGIHVVQIEKMWSGLQVGKYPTKYSRGLATYAVHIGELEGLRNEPAFVFYPHQSGSHLGDEIARLAQICAGCGLSFSKSIASYEALLPLLEARTPQLGGYPQRFVSCLYLMGRKRESREFVESFLPTHRDAFEGFAGPFLAKLDAERI